MGVGLQVFDSSGRLRFNSGDYLVRFLGGFNTGTSPGSITDASLTTSGSTPFYVYYPLKTSLQHSGAYVTISGNTLSWNWSDSNSSRWCPGIILYGLR